MAFYCTKHNCRKRFVKEAGMAAHIAKCAGGRTDVVRVKTGTEATDAAEGMMNQQCATMPTNRTERQPSPNTLPPMGFGRNQGRGAAQHNSEVLAQSSSSSPGGTTRVQKGRRRRKRGSRQLQTSSA